jgi:hypothetical protein
MNRPVEKRTKCAIVGFASSSRDQAPYKDESFEIWSLNHAYNHVPRWDRWYEIHPRAHFERDLMRDGLTQDGKRHIEWLAKEPAGGRPIYCQDHYDDIPASVRWPREEINEWFRMNGAKEPLPHGFYAEDYFTSTPAQMLAHAIYLGFEEIHLYGIDMLQSEEYFYQRSGCEYYTAFARGRGIKVFIPPSSALCKANYTYGYSEPPTDIEHLQPYVDYLQTKINESDLNKQKAVQAAQTIDGGLQMARIVLQLINGDGVITRDEKGDPVVGEDGNPVKHPCELADIKMECEKQISLLDPKIREAQNTIVAMDGQIAGFRCSQSWAEHYARGGKLS